jgi:prephenate dehydrogenase
MALRQRKLAKRVDACVRREASIAECLKMGAVDSATLDLASAVTGADLVVLCTPLAQMRDLAERMLPYLKPGAIVTDVGSVKSNVVQDLTPMIARVGAEFIGSHPMAGSEKSGVQFAQADLFQGALCLITPSSTSSAQAIRSIQTLWKGVGCSTLRLRPDTHDDLVSRSSHLPHIVAAELANYVLSPVHPKEQAMLCASGFRDTTRVASGPPEVWRDIVMANRKHLTRVLGVFIEDLRELQFALERADIGAIEEFLTKAKQRRDKWQSQAGNWPPE